MKTWRSKETNHRSVASAQFVYWVPVSMQTSKNLTRLWWGTMDSNMQHNALFLREDMQLPTSVYDIVRF